MGPKYKSLTDTAKGARGCTFGLDYGYDGRYGFWWGYKDISNRGRYVVCPNCGTALHKGAGHWDIVAKEWQCNHVSAPHSPQLDSDDTPKPLGWYRKPLFERQRARLLAQGVSLLPVPPAEG
jgi:hypothetical protein